MADTDITLWQPVAGFLAPLVNPDKVLAALAVAASVVCLALSIRFVRAQPGIVQALAAGAGALSLTVPTLRQELVAGWYRFIATEGYESLLYAGLQIAEVAGHTFAAVLLIAALLIRLFHGDGGLRIAVDPAASAAPSALAARAAPEVAT